MMVKPMIRQNEFELLLKFQRAQLTEEQRQRRRHIVPSITLYPHAAENYYYENIKTFQKKIVEKSFTKLNTRVKPWLHTDDQSTDLSAYRKEMEDEILALYLATLTWNSPIGELINQISTRVFTFNNEQWAKQIRKILSIDWNTTADWWPELQKQWAENNYVLIKNLSKEYLTKLETLIITAVQSFWSYSDLEQQINKLAQTILNRRSALIARDQIGILLSQIWQKQYEEIGLSTYIWQTALDERVRGNPMGRYPKAIPSHYVMEGLIMDWNNRSVFSRDGKTWEPKTGIMEPLHVGMAINCRCVPRPYWDNVLSKVDSSIKEGL